MFDEHQQMNNGFYNLQFASNEFHTPKLIRIEFIGGRNREPLIGLQS